MRTRFKTADKPILAENLVLAILAVMVHIVLHRKMMVLPVMGQDKEADRVKAAGDVIAEIMNVPDDIPQSVIDKADCVFGTGKAIYEFAVDLLS